MNRTATLRISLLVSMGIVPVACGGATNGDKRDDPSGGSGGSFAQGGTRNSHAGTATTTGGTAVTISGGTSTGGTGIVTGGTGVIIEGGSPDQECTSPHVDPHTGLVSCSEGFVHRPTATACLEVVGGAPNDDGCGASGASGNPNCADPVALKRADGTVPCQSNPSICNQFAYGYCNNSIEGGAAPPHTCYSGCATDADCGPDAVCLCNAPASPTGGACRPASCKVDKDCPSGLCANVRPICGADGFSCVTSHDECLSDADCAVGKCTNRTCGSGYACGRPFLVHAQARVAPVTHGASWRAAERLQPRVDHLTEAERAAFAAHWSHLGQLEHASIAAFARFQLQLLALGAPPDLVESCTQALADETAHTRLCFELASAYAGRSVGPGPLDIDGSLAASSLSEIVDLVLLEGCFGETGAALDAFEAAESTADPVIRAAYARIAEDEQRHAELAFRFVRWALQRSGGEVAERIAAALAAPPNSSAATLEVTLPCLRALLDTAAPLRLSETSSKTERRTSRASRARRPAPKAAPLRSSACAPPSRAASRR
jgi:hypothetical protein